jgi:signal peptidase II
MVLAADLATKAIIAGTFHPHEVRRVFGDWVRLTYIHNPGAAFGLFPGSRAALIAISISAVVVVAVVAWRSRGGAGSVIPLGLILGGALGNLVDRIRLGEVVDFVQVGIPPHWYWPVFNVADSAVTIGVAWLALGLVRGKNADEAAPLVEEPVAHVAPSGDEA